MMMPMRFAALCVLVSSAAAYANSMGDPELNWAEGRYDVPPLPALDGSSLEPVYVSAIAQSRFFIDTSSLVVGEDSAVRYVLVTEAAGGAQTTMFAGIHCGSGRYRVYAMEYGGGEWRPAANEDWVPLPANRDSRAEQALAYDYFCNGLVPWQVPDILRRLRHAPAVLGGGNR